MCDTVPLAPMFLLSLASCLLLMDKPPSCPESCPGNYDCSPSTGCLSTCNGDNDCEDGYYCDIAYSECEEACQDGDCPGGFSCWFEDECNDYCFDDNDCASGYYCCDYDRSCPDSRVGDCLDD